MARFIMAKGSNENTWEQFSVFQIAEFLYARDFTITQVIEAIRELCEIEEANWDEDTLRGILENADKGMKGQN